MQNKNLERMNKEVKRTRNKIENRKIKEKIEIKIIRWATYYA